MMKRAISALVTTGLLAGFLMSVAWAQEPTPTKPPYRTNQITGASHAFPCNSSGSAGTMVDCTLASYFTFSGSQVQITALPVANGGTGASTFSTGLPLFGAGASSFTTGTLSGNTTKLATTTGSLVNGHTVAIDASGNFIDSGGTGGGSGTVTSVTLGVPGSSLFGTSGTNPVTTSGTFSITTTGTSGGIPYFNDTTHLNTSAALTANLPVFGGGAGVAPFVGTRSGNTTQVATTTGAQTSGRCVIIDASGNHVADSGACSGGSLPSIASGHVIGNGTTGTTTAADTSLLSGTGLVWSATGGNITLSASNVFQDRSSVNDAIVAGDGNKLVEVGNHTYTIAQATGSFGSGYGVRIANVAGAGNAVITATTSVFKGASGTTTLTLAPGDWADLASDGTDYVTNLGHYTSGGGGSLAVGPGFTKTLGSDNTTPVVVGTDTLFGQNYIVPKTSPYSLVLATDANHTFLANGASITFTMPQAVSGNKGSWACFGDSASNGFTLTSTTSTFKGMPGLSSTSSPVFSAKSALCAGSDGTDWILAGTHGTIPAAQSSATPLTTGTSVTLTAPRQYFVCTSTCTVTPPVPAAGYEFCVLNGDNVATVITMAAIGSSARYENTVRTAYGTAGTGTFISGGAVGDKVCLLGLDATHYLTISSVGSWTTN